MTERLYYRDPALLAFDAVVVSTQAKDGRQVVVLDRSAFYPTSGGQRHDLGTLNGVPVLEVQESPEGEVWHITEGTAGAVGEKVHGEIEPMRRRRNRQQHSAQHILSQAFIRLYGWETVSVHLGEEYGTVELSTPEIGEKQLEEAEALANDLIAQNLPIEILFLDSADLANTPLRKVPDRVGTIRVIKIGEFDWSACGGTHCCGTGEVGLIKLVGVEKIRNRPLVRFLAGSQALDDYRVRYAVTEGLSRAFTCHVKDLPVKTEKLTVENRDLRKQVTELQRQLLPIRAEGLAAAATGTLKVVASVQSDLDGTAASHLAQLTAEKIGGVALIAADGRLIVATAESSGRHAGEIVKKLAAELGLRGGGSNRVAQLGGVDAVRLTECERLVAVMVGHE
jgi:alanyl-tRNA synthetase